MIIVKKDSKSIDLIGQQADSILQAYKDPKRQNDVIEVQGQIFRVKDIKEIIGDKVYDDDGQVQRRLYLEKLNTKGKIKEWAELGIQQYQLLKDKAECLEKKDYESSKDIQGTLEENTNKMKVIAKQHNL